MIVRGIEMVLVHAGDLRSARAFYSETLGLTEASADDTAIRYDLGPGPALLVRLATVDPGPSHPSPRIWLKVPDARAAAESLRAAGVRLMAEPWSTAAGWVVEIADPWGNVLGFADATGA